MNMIRNLWLLAILLCLGGPVLADRNDQQRELLRELRELVDKSARENAADRWLQRDLEDLVRRFSPARMRELLYEDFRDGNYTRNPGWKVLEGEFEVYKRHGLVSVTGRRRAPEPREDRRDSKKAIEEMVLGAILGGDATRNRETPRNTDDGVNAIRLRADVPNIFALALALRLEPDRGNKFDIMLQQRRDGHYGYRLRLRSGRRNVARLYRVGRGREVLLYETDLPTAMNDGQRHDLVWRHRRNGELQVLLDGLPMITLDEQHFRDGYPWLVIRHLRGELALRSVRLRGVPDS